ncbi:MAG: quinone-dependent dihydroorotate dehydrogenase [Steroidobacterales bacterium]
MRRAVSNALVRASLPVLSHLDPELAHDVALAGLGLLRPLWRGPAVPTGLALRCFGLQFSHPLGLAAGFDKNADYLDALGALGFSHIEVGTVTPRSQPGNPKPRLFRFRGAQALVNRMGFNNKGVDHLVTMLARSRYRGVRGISIGKNFDTPIENAERDYVHCLRKVYPYADYVAVNVSSPNTARLRELQDRDGLQRIVGALLEARITLSREFGKRVPLLVKVAPNLDTKQIATIAQLLRELQVDGVIATNTSTNLQEFRDALPPDQLGGLSGAPLHRLSISVITQLRAALGADFPIIGVGGIVDAASALETLRAGANLLQVYTGFALHGHLLIGEILAALAAQGHDRSGQHR